MKVADYKKNVPQPLRQATLLFLLRDGNILLALKKRGFGAGKMNGVGGKPNPGETIEQTAVREAQEEIGVTPKKFKKVATLDFYFPHTPLDKNWNMQVVTFFCHEWEGEPVESEEMAPKWFDVDALPFADMWSDDVHWLPRVLAGKFVEAEFAFDKDGGVADFVLQETGNH